MSGSLTADSRAEVSRSNLAAWVVCLSAGLFFFYEFFQLNLFDVINQSLRDEFKIDATELSWMSSTYLWGDLIFLIPAGLILDRYSARLVTLITMLLCVIGTICFALTTSFFWASVFHSIVGVGNAFCFLCCVVLVSRWFMPRRQALVIGSVITMAFLGGMMAHTPLAYLNNNYGWRNALLIDGAIGAFIFLWIYIFVKDSPEDKQSHTTKPHATPSFTKAIVNPQNWLSGFYTSCLNLPILVICALWGASYLQVVHQLSQIAASNVVSLIFIGSIIGCPLVGWLSDKSGHRKPLMIAGAIATLIVLIPLLIDIKLSVNALSIIFFMLGFITSTQVITYPLIAESNCPSNIGASTAIASVIIMGGGAVGQVLFGWLMQLHAGSAVNQYGVADFKFAMWMFPIAAAAALIAILFTKETNCKRN